MHEAISHLKNSDPVLSAIIDRVGPCEMQFRDPDFATLVRSIVYQQLSGKVASVIFGRLIAALPGKKLTPTSLLRLSLEQMRAAGLSAAKAKYIRDLAERTKARQVIFKNLSERTDDEVIEHLTQVKGIGVWTAHMFLIFALKRPDILPVGDLGVRAAIRKAYALEELPKPSEVEAIAQSWRPYCSVAAWYLWRSLDGPALP